MEGERKDFSAVGMRVLAVDDSPLCLKVLEAMLRQCEYHVTTSNQAVEALKMLRENKDKFDLIITDVHMPDMDGFKLLEIVGYELDLPVIMLSANGNRDFVMKGIAHGACDYLLKPVRIEELKNIWQHVFRKTVLAPREHNHSNYAPQGPVMTGSADHKQSIKREDQSEEEDDGDENTNDIENVTSQKKARVNWSKNDLHPKFMAAVDQLGIDKAQPKTILALMNVEGISRQNVASHLQKYKQFLRKQASQKENSSPVMGGRDSYLPFVSIQPFTSSNQFSVLSSVQNNGGMSRRQPTLLGYNSVSPGIPQATRTQCTSNFDVSKFQNFTGTQQGNLLQRIPTTTEVGQLQLRRRIHEANNNFPVSVSASSIMNNPLMLQAQHIPIISGPFEANAGLSSHFPERYNETLQSVVSLAGCSANTLPVTIGFSPSVSQCNPMDFSFSSSFIAPPSDLVTGNTLNDMQKGFNERSRCVNFGSGQQQWADSKQVHNPVRDNVFSSINPPLAGPFIGDVISEIEGANSGITNMTPANINGQMNYNTETPIADNQMKYKDDFLLEASTSPGGLNCNDYSSGELFMSNWDLLMSDIGGGNSYSVGVQN